MTRPGMLVAATLLTTLLGSAGTARADGIYFSESFGGSTISNELGDYQADAFRIRVALGYRASRVSFEAWMGGDIGDDYNYAIPEANSPDPLTYGMDLKYAFPLSRRTEVYLRGSASRMEISEGLLDGYAGRGLGAGAGIQIKGKAPLITLLYPPIALACLVPGVCKKLGPRATVAGFFDLGSDFYRLHDPRGGRGAVDASVTRWTIGFAIGSDF